MRILILVLEILVGLVIAGTLAPFLVLLSPALRHPMALLLWAAACVVGTMFLSRRVLKARPGESPGRH